MAFQMKIDEMLDALCNSGNPRAVELQKATEELADKLAAAICQQFSLECDPASFQGLAFAGTCVPFYGTKLPDELAGYDDPDEFCSREEWHAMVRA